MVGAWRGSTAGPSLRRRRVEPPGQPRRHASGRGLRCPQLLPDHRPCRGKLLRRDGLRHGLHRPRRLFRGGRDRGGGAANDEIVHRDVGGVDGRHIGHVGDVHLPTYSSEAYKYGEIGLTRTQRHPADAAGGQRRAHRYPRRPEPMNATSAGA